MTRAWPGCENVPPPCSSLLTIALITLRGDAGAGERVCLDECVQHAAIVQVV